MNQLAATAAPVATNPGIAKPSRRDYMRVAVTKPDGTEVPPAVWQDLVINIKPRAQTRALKKQGYVTTGMFDKTAYMAARTQFRAAAKVDRQASKSQLIDQAFINAGVPKEPHIEKAARDLLPILSEVSAKKAVIVLKNVIRTVHNGIMHPHETEAVATPPVVAVEPATQPE